MRKILTLSYWDHNLPDETVEIHEENDEIVALDKNTKCLVVEKRKIDGGVKNTSYPVDNLRKFSIETFPPAEREL